MKELNQDQMNHVSGAGFAQTEPEFNYKNYDNFTTYMSFMLSSGFDPLAPHVPGLQAAYKSWSAYHNLDAVGNAANNGWNYRGC